MRAISTIKSDLEDSLIQSLEKPTYSIGNAIFYLSKSAGIPTITHNLSGKLFISKSGWLLLTVPSALLKGAFDALDEHGAELPKADGKFVPHISVMNAEEVESIGGKEKITERGHSFSYTLGPVKEVTPKTWDGVSKCWYITIHSKDLETLRKSYGLSSKLNGYDFHATFAVRKKHVLRDNEVSKSVIKTSAVNDLAANLLSRIEYEKKSNFSVILPSLGIGVAAIGINHLVNPPSKKKKEQIDIPDIEMPKQARSVIQGLKPRHNSFENIYTQSHSIIETLLSRFQEKQEKVSRARLRLKQAGVFTDAIKDVGQGAANLFKPIGDLAAKVPYSLAGTAARDLGYGKPPPPPPPPPKPWTLPLNPDYSPRSGEFGNRAVGLKSWRRDIPGKPEPEIKPPSINGGTGKGVPTNLKPGTFKRNPFPFSYPNSRIGSSKAPDLTSNMVDWNHPSMDPNKVKMDRFKDDQDPEALRLRIESVRIKYEIQRRMDLREQEGLPQEKLITLPEIKQIQQRVKALNLK